ncbi:MAG: 50S ribosomal protein L20 [Candidatus Wildermuthbacteria bacterium RIFCSPLOWO2_02_FULL_47_9c]|uniref:Large ribosomal subunit protein bL20 n=1 Tax=Candidatus Wildermuthbacteria bacterium RIFCSPLOWO2_02_FULL_47_9c TaxID=1802466 RepID=A0A1G2RZ37_9BACT|nr:MAG: 50S ribosomal protein L20 [Candidatus Wildermuthbacteria bacterium RIFCSPLOWO2_02_FULL_47_9c]
MPRVKRGTTAKKRRKHVLQHAKGFKWGRKSKYRLAKDALRHAWTYAYRDRKANKREFRALWQIQINAASREQGVSYSKFMGQLKKKNIVLDRKVLAQLAEQKPEAFAAIVNSIK